MIESFLADMAKEALMQELGPYILCGVLTGMMFIAYHATNKVDQVIERKAKRR